MNISIIIPTYNEAARIGETIRMVKKRASDEISLQIIVADGGSSDETVKKAKQAGAEVIADIKKRRSVQMNAGAQQACHEILYFLHADTHPPPQFDRLIKQSLKGQPEAGCFRLSFDLDNALLNFYGWCTRFDVELFRFGDQSLFVRRSVFEKFNGFQDGYILLEDQDMVKRIKKNHTFALLPQRVVTSARKYICNGPVRLQCIYAGIVMLYKMGLAQQKLYYIYKCHLR